MGDYGFYRQIVVDKDKCDETDANFAVLLNLTAAGSGILTDLKTTGNGGDIQNTDATGGASGSYTVPADLTFRTSADMTEAGAGLDFEIEYYDATTGDLIAWVQSGVIVDTDVDIYMVYGNSGVTTSQENVTGTWDSDFEAVYHLGESSGTIYDSTANGRSSSAQKLDGSPGNYQAAGAIGYGVELDGADDYITLADFDLVHISYEAWFKADQTSSEAWIVSKNGSPVWFLRLYSNKLQALSRTAAGANQPETAFTDTASLHYGVGTWDGDNCILYLDGILKDTAGASDGDLVTSSDEVEIGSRNAGSQWWNGIIDEVRISSTARSANYISTTYNNQSSPDTFYSVGSEVGVDIQAAGIASAEAFGTVVIPILRPTGIASAEAFGTPAMAVTLQPTGIASAEAFGTAELGVWGKDAGTVWGDGALWGDTTLWGDRPGWGTGKLWGTGVLWGQRPYPYPRGNHISLEIRTASGSDYTSKAIDTSWRIESILSQRASHCYFTFRDTDASDIDEHDEVIITDQSQTRLFAGFVESFEARPDGVEIEYDVVCVDYSWLLDHPSSKITKIYESETEDSKIIEDFADYVSEIDFETSVATIESSLEREYYENMTPRQILDLLCKRTGGQWYVDYGGAGDYKASLHYYVPGSADAPFSLVDGINLNPVSAFPYGDLRYVRKHGTCTKVIVEGRPIREEVSLESCCTDEADGVKKRFDLPYKISPLQDEIRPLIYVTDGAGGYDWQKVGYGGTQDSLGDPDDGLYEALYYSEDKYLEFFTAPSAYSGAAFKYSATEVRPTEGEAEDATGAAKYGRHLEIRVIDDTVHDEATADLVAAELLARWKGEQDTYTCVCWEHGLRAGQVIGLVNADLGISDDFTIQRVTSRGMGGDLWEHDLELGKYNPVLADVIQDLVTHKSGKEELGLKESSKPPIIGQIMFAVPGTLSLTDDAAPWFICSVNGLEILGTQLAVKTAPEGAIIVIDIEKSTDDGGTWDSLYYDQPFISGNHTGGDNESTLTDSGASFAEDYVGLLIANGSDHSSGIITAVNSSTNLSVTLEGGTDNDWDSLDGYLIAIAGGVQAGQKVGTGGLLTIIELNEGDLLRLDVEQAGSTTAGADLTVSLKVRQ